MSVYCMPKEGFTTITVPEELVKRISHFVEGSKGMYHSIPQVLLESWGSFELRNLPIQSSKNVKIGNKVIGHDQPPYIIAEVGINHNGDMEVVKKMIDIAVEKGCDAVKFQKRTIEAVYTPEEMEKPREVPAEIIRPAVERGAFNEEDTRRIREELEKVITRTYPVMVKTGDQKRMLEFGDKGYQEIKEYCSERGIDWFASPWDLESVDFLEKYDPVCYKVASASMTDKKLLEKIRATGKPIILSTGMSELKQVVKAVDTLGGTDNLVLLQCTSTYPSRDEELNLHSISTLRKYFNCPVGYSGHEPGIWPSIVAAAQGAAVIERHITLGRSMYGSDQSASLEPRPLGDMTRAIKRVPTMLGSYEVKVVDSEKPIAEKLRKVDNL